jgi:hypothetical protein
MKLSHWLAAALIVGGTTALAEPGRGFTRMDAEVVPGQIDNTTTTDEVAIGRDVGDRMTVDVRWVEGPYRFHRYRRRTHHHFTELAHHLQLEVGKNATCTA